MGSSSSVVGSVESSRSLPMAATSTPLKPQSLGTANSSTSIGTTTPNEKNVTVDKNHSRSFEHKQSNVHSRSVHNESEDNNCIDTNFLLEKLKEHDMLNEKQEETKKELTSLLEELALPDQEMQSALQFLKDNTKLLKQLKICANCVLTFKLGAIKTCRQSLQELEMAFFEINYIERTAIGEFLTYLRFSKESYAMYKKMLEAIGAEHFSDSLLDFDDENEFEIMNILNLIRTKWWNFTDASPVFCSQIASEACIIQELIHNVKSLIGAEGKTLKFSATFDSSMGIFHNIARQSDSRNLFREMKLVELFANFLNYDDQPEVMMLVLIVLAHIIDEDQTHLLTSHDSVFDLMIALIKQALRFKDHRYDGFSAEELIEAMAGLSRNDTVKKVVVKKGILDILLKILTEGCGKEQEISMKLLWELSFDPENKIKIQEDETMMKTVKEMSKHANKNVARSAQGVLLVLGMETDKEQSNEKLKKKSKESKGNKGHIMISYNWKDQKKLMEIRNFLKSNGYEIWMDIDNIHGSTLQAMAEAVEQAVAVLVCMSETYKESPNCRSEAEYAFSLQKPIIPLLMQSEYKPDGWLGILLGTKIFFNFSGKYPFEKKIAELIKEIGARGKSKDGVPQDNTDGPITKTQNIPLGKTPPSTSEINVQEWIKEHNLTEYTILQTLSPEHLQFLKKLSSRAPEFYYSFMLDFMSGKVSSQDLSRLMLVTGAIDNVSR